MKYLFNKLIANRDGFAVATFLAAVPLIYFLRDGIKLAPGNSFFLVFLLLLPYFFSLLFKDIRSFDTPNVVGTSLLSIFIIVSLIYFILRDRFTGVNGSREILNNGLILFLYFATLFLKRDSLNKNFFYLVFILSVLGALTLIYYTFTNPFYQFGQRASIAFDEKGGNPHNNSRGAYFGLIGVVLMLKYNKVFRIGLIIPLISIVLFVVVLFLTQTMLAILSTFIFLGLFFYFNYSLREIAGTIKFLLTKWYVLLMLSIGLVKGVSMLKKNADFISPLTHYMSHRYDNIVKSFGSDDGKVLNKSKGDVSANTRIHLIKAVFERIEKNIETGKVRYIIFGNGYQSLYIDNPHLEVLDSFGIINFVFYTIFFFYMIRIAVLEMKNPESMGAEFIAYAFIYYFIANFIAGLMVDYTRFGMYILLVRFVRK